MQNSPGNGDKTAASQKSAIRFLTTLVQTIGITETTKMK